MTYLTILSIGRRRRNNKLKVNYVLYKDYIKSTYLVSTHELRVWFYMSLTFPAILFYLGASTGY